MVFGKSYYIVLTSDISVPKKYQDKQDSKKAMVGQKQIQKKIILSALTS